MIPLGSGDEMESKCEHAHFAKRYHGINLSPGTQSTDFQVSKINIIRGALTTQSNI